MHYDNICLILGDQLNAGHSWFQKKDQDTLFVIAELYQETQYTKHHIQKLCGFFMAMDRFAKALKKAGHEVLHLSLDDTQEFSNLPDLISHLTSKYKATTFHYQRPDEYRLLEQLRNLDIPNTEIKESDTEHFLLPFEEIEKTFKPNKAHRMEAFYRKMRKRFNILMNGDEPAGGKWNFDQDNRGSLSEEAIQSVPEPISFSHDARSTIKRLDKHGVEYFGNLNNKQSFIWPITRSEARQVLDYFCDSLLPKFGLYQDAMTLHSAHAWSLYHSRLSFALNTKMISPLEVIQKAIQAYEQSNQINLAQIEGFVRQILGWREFIRAMYWINMPEYQNKNSLDASRSLPNYFWSSETKMQCMRACLSQSLEHAYAHHIQRLMIIGNFSLLTGLDPKAVDAWYLGVYIDAIEWVEMPNTRGMSQFADGGLVASKPYAGSANYINKMSDYCQSCHYKHNQKTGDRACPFNSLYWHFLDRHQEKFAKNPRMALTYKNWQKQKSENKEVVLKQAKTYLNDIEAL